MDNLLNNLDKLHTTELGKERISKNLGIDVPDIVEWCRQQIKNAKKIIRQGKNWYVYFDVSVITVNAHSFTIITAHKERKTAIEQREYYQENRRHSRTQG